MKPADSTDVPTTATGPVAAAASSRLPPAGSGWAPPPPVVSHRSAQGPPGTNLVVKPLTTEFQLCFGCVLPPLLRSQVDSQVDDDSFEVEEDIEIEVSAGGGDGDYDGSGSDYGGGAFGFAKAGSSSEQSFGSVGGFD